MPKGYKTTHEQFVSQIADCPFITLDKYVRGGRMRFRCTTEGCSNEWEAIPSNILNGTGCPRCGHWRSGKAHRKSNSILHDYGDGTILIDVSTPKYPNATSKMDSVDFTRLHGRISLNRMGYPQAYSHGVQMMVHKFLFPEWDKTDHINRDTTDNRRCNLRRCTHSQNAQNRSMRSDNSSGITGVSWFKSRRKWLVRISVNKKEIRLGYFASKEDAIKARYEAEDRYYGEFSARRSSSN